MQHYVNARNVNMSDSIVGNITSDYEGQTMKANIPMKRELFWNYVSNQDQFIS